MSNKLYDKLKNVVTIYLPAFITFVLTLSNIFSWEKGELIALCLTAFNTFLGSIIGVSSYYYKVDIKENKK